MNQFLIKVLISALVIAAASELAKRQAWLGALIASLPLTSILAMIWLWRDGTESTQIAAFASGILWLILPSLLLFIVLPAMLHAGFSFWTSLGAGCATTVLGYGLTLLALRAWGAH